MVKSRDFRPLSSMQLGIWFESTLSDPKPCHNIGEMVDILGPISVSAFEEALRQLVAETEALRTVFSENEYEPRQLFSAESQISLATLDVSHESDPWGSMLDVVQHAMKEIIQLNDRKLFSFTLIKLADAHFVWHHRYHHIIIDGFGCSLIAQRMAELYSAVISGVAPARAKFGSLTGVLDGDIAYLASEDLRADREFWLDYLSSVPDPPRLGNATSKYLPIPIRKSSALPKAFVSGLTEIAMCAGTTISRTLIAVVVAYLCRFSG